MVIKDGKQVGGDRPQIGGSSSRSGYIIDGRGSRGFSGLPALGRGGQYDLMGLYKKKLQEEYQKEVERQRAAYLNPILSEIKKQRDIITEKEKYVTGLPTKVSYKQAVLRRQPGMANFLKRQVAARQFAQKAFAQKQDFFKQSQAARRQLQSREAEARRIASTIR